MILYTSRHRNPISGRKSPGFRFRFCVRKIQRRNLWLPLAMKKLPEIQKLLAGSDPTEVFAVDSIEKARLAFNQLRYAYDFSFWAANEYYIHDLKDPDEIVPLRLNVFQHEIIDTFERRFFQKENGRYIVSKSYGRCGVTTCVQAYILWRQLFVLPKHSYTCCASDINIHPIKSNLCRFLKRDIVPTDKRITIPQAHRSNAHFYTFRSPNAVRGVDLGYMHFADMSKWKDPFGDYSEQAYTTGWGSVLLHYNTLMVLEGNIPESLVCQIDNDENPDSSFEFGMLKGNSQNPYFLQQVIHARPIHPHPYPHFHSIRL